MCTFGISSYHYSFVHHVLDASFDSGECLSAESSNFILRCTAIVAYCRDCQCFLSKVNTLQTQMKQRIFIRRVRIATAEHNYYYGLWSIQKKLRHKRASEPRGLEFTELHLVRCQTTSANTWTSVRTSRWRSNYSSLLEPGG